MEKELAEIRRLLRLIIVILVVIASGHGLDIADVIPGY